MANSYVVSVPATTANIGPGFDCLGAALTRYNRFTFTPLTGAEPLQITVTGAEHERVATDASNLAYVAFSQFFAHIQQPVPPVRLQIKLGLPLARGLGSSSTAIVGGILGANALADQVLSPAELAQLATAIEGHPDNVVPALLGGCRLATANEAGDGMICEVPWQAAIIPIVAIPAFEISTAKARDRKSTRLNSSHRCISYAVFCLKKKKKKNITHKH